MPQIEISKPEDQSLNNESKLTRGIDISVLLGLFLLRAPKALGWFASESTEFIIAISALLVYTLARLGIDIIGYLKGGNRLKIMRVLRFAGMAVAALSSLLGLHWIFIAAGIATALPSFGVSVAHGLRKAYRFIRDSIREMYSEDNAYAKTKNLNQ